jgi:hypothetical protein
MALRGLVHGLAPSIVVVGGEIANAWFLIGPILTDHLKSFFIVPELAAIRVLPSVIHHRPSLVGAVTMGIFPEMTYPSERFSIVEPEITKDRLPGKAAREKNGHAGRSRMVEQFLIEQAHSRSLDSFPRTDKRGS